MSECAHSTVTLPVLNHGNRAEHADWHLYYERVYGEPVRSGTAVDLNTFTWFYSFAPLPPEWECVMRTIRLGWGEDDERPFGALLRFQGREDSPETILSRSGAFVKRCTDQALLKDEYIEVLRTNQGDGANETRSCWFFHTVGSGFWIRTRRVCFPRGRHLDHENDLLELVLRLEEGKAAGEPSNPQSRLSRSARKFQVGEGQGR